MRTLTGRQQLWLQFYLHGQRPQKYNATQSAIAAGYAPRSARNQGSANLRNPLIQAAIEQNHAEFMRQHEERQARRIAQLMAGG